MEGSRATTGVSATHLKAPASPELVLPPRQLELLATQPIGKDNCSTTFAENLSLPIHSWFRYSAGFSALWVREVISRQIALGRRRILDPFAGSGTVLLECERSVAEAKGIEAHPFILRVGQAKLHWRINPQAFRAGLARSGVHFAAMLSRRDCAMAIRIAEKKQSPRCRSIRRISCRLQKLSLRKDTRPEC